MGLDGGLREAKVECRRGILVVRGEKMRWGGIGYCIQLSSTF